MKNNKIIFKEDVLNHIHSYMKNILHPLLGNLYKILNDIDILRNIPLVDCDVFEKICKEEITGEDLINSLIMINAILKSENLDSLNTCELYHDILSGKIHPKPTTTIESLNLVDDIRKIALKDYQEIIDSFNMSCLGDITSDSFNQFTE